MNKEELITPQIKKPQELVFLFFYSIPLEPDKNDEENIQDEMLLAEWVLSKIAGKY